MDFLELTVQNLTDCDFKEWKLKIIEDKKIKVLRGIIPLEKFKAMRPRDVIDYILGAVSSTKDW